MPSGANTSLHGGGRQLVMPLSTLSKPTHLQAYTRHQTLVHLAGQAKEWHNSTAQGPPVRRTVPWTDRRTARLCVTHNTRYKARDGQPRTFTLYFFECSARPAGGGDGSCRELPILSPS